MYLEISPRRSGKTERLKKSIIKRLMTGKDCFLFTFNYSYTNKLKRDISHICDISNLHTPTNKRDISKFIMGRSFNKPKIYYDEFDLCKSVILDFDGYYCTTPTRLRTVYDIVAFNKGDKDDPLQVLLSINNGKVIRYDSHYTNIVDILGKLDTRQTKLELEGAWMDFNNMGFEYD